MDVKEIFDGCPGDMYCVSESFFIFAGDISLVSRRYYVGLLKLFDVCPEDIWWVTCRYLNGDLEMLDRCPGDI